MQSPRCWDRGDGTTEVRFIRSADDTRKVSKSVGLGDECMTKLTIFLLFFFLVGQCGISLIQL